MKFAELQLEQSLQSAIDKLGYQEATPVQESVIPYVIEGKDVSGLAPTGTGKTAAFLIPLMDRILKGRNSTENLSPEQVEFLQKRSFPDWKAQNFILILVPTRELCEQVQENATKLSVVSGLRSIAVYGGTGYEKQKEAFQNQVEFVVATPGRLIDLYKENFVDLKQVRAVVFDEADRMFDMGFKDDMKFVLSRIPKTRQFLVFSATMNFDVLNTAYQFGAEPIEINVSGEHAKAENVKDEVFHVGNQDKPMYLLSLLKRHNPKQAIIFSNFKFNVDRVAKFLNDNGVPAMGISSLLTQVQRNRVIEQFKADNEKNILVATDVAARGLDIKGVDLVINYELPQDAESYVHRIGRTGRAGAEGQAYSLSSEKDVDSLARIEDYLKHKVEIGWLDEADIIKEYKEFPREDYAGRRGGGGDRKDFKPRQPRFDRQNDRPQRGGDNRSDNRGERPEGSRGGGRRDFRDNRNQRDQRDSREPREGQAHTHAKDGHKRYEAKPRDFTKHPNSHNKDKHQDKHSDKHQARHAGKHSPRHKPHKPKSYPSRKPAPTVVAKVTSFFKKLFGGSEKSK